MVAATDYWRRLHPYHLAYDDLSIWPPALYWGSGFAAGMTMALLVAEDHSYTFKTTEQLQSGPSRALPYGPNLQKAA